jgi:hypothetical protein
VGKVMKKYKFLKGVLAAVIVATGACGQLEDVEAAVIGGAQLVRSLYMPLLLQTRD